MRRALGDIGIRLLTAGAAVAVLVGAVGFWSFVVISRDVLRRSMGPGPLVLVLSVAAAVTAVWGSVLVSRALRPGRHLPRRARIGLVGVTLLAAATGLVAVPTTRARLERDKCHRVAASDDLSQARCRTWLESRRQWWTLGLSHENPAQR